MLIAVLAAAVGTRFMQLRAGGQQPRVTVPTRFRIKPARASSQHVSLGPG
ncbi:hypothetical protein BZL30_8381 [Mycobacterium kansasii]|uniref:Uncharacterized protein n=1 Tax=Mycobacterium kansasii TaxID=1768 RepID=A0A1V3WKK8_MYCKA|nr:hypothetical protein BZL30_8381 [Mycobacterium kansasii]